MAFSIPDHWNRELDSRGKFDTIRSADLCTIHPNATLDDDDDDDEDLVLFRGALMYVQAKINQYSRRAPLRS